MSFWIFYIKAKKLIKNNEVKTAKANKAINNQKDHAIQIANKVVCALQTNKLNIKRQSTQHT